MASSCCLFLFSLSSLCSCNDFFFGLWQIHPASLVSEHRFHAFFITAIRQDSAILFLKPSKFRNHFRRDFLTTSKTNINFFFVLKSNQMQLFQGVCRKSFFYQHKPFLLSDCHIFLSYTGNSKFKFYNKKKLLCSHVIIEKQQQLEII